VPQLETTAKAIHQREVNTSAPRMFYQKPRSVPNGFGVFSRHLIKSRKAI